MVEKPILDFDTLINSINQMNKRCEELNDVKLTIRQLNDTVKNDIFTNMDPFVALLKLKLTEFSNDIKEKLKLHHKIISEKQTNLSSKLTNLLNEIAQKTFEIQILDENKDEKSKELYFWAVKEHQEIVQELNSYQISDFYPNLKYSVPTDQLKDAINSIKMDIKSDDVELDEIKLAKIGVDQAIDCVITSGLDDNGRFWLQLSTENNQSARVIDDISKFIRFKRITDSTWFTFDEDPQKRVPELHEKCFCLNNKSKKWLRVVIEEFNNEKNVYKVRCCDTNTVDNDVQLDKLMKWKDFSLNDIDFQSIRCCLFVPQSEKRFTYDTKYLFKDLTHNKKFKCVFKQFLDNNIWLVELYSQLDYEKIICDSDIQHCSINKYIIDDYNENLCMKKTRTCADIRLDDKNPAIKICYNVVSYSDNNLSNKVATESVVESVNEPCLTESCSMSENIAQLINNINVGDDIMVISNVISDIISNIESNIDNVFDGLKLEDKLYETADENNESEDTDSVVAGRSGECFISTDISENGTFWISPKVNSKSLKKIGVLSNVIGNFLNETKQKSFLELNIDPHVGMKCFVAVLDKNKKVENKRGLIEEVDYEKKHSIVCLVDRGTLIVVSFRNSYPFTEFKGVDFKFKAVRCAISKIETLKLNEEAAKLFNFHRQKTSMRFVLIEKVVINNKRHWYVGLQLPDNVFLNEIVLKLNEDQQCVKQSDNKKIELTVGKKKQKNKKAIEKKKLLNVDDQHIHDSTEQQKQQLKDQYFHNFQIKQPQDAELNKQKQHSLPSRNLPEKWKHVDLNNNAFHQNYPQKMRHESSGTEFEPEKQQQQQQQQPVIVQRSHKPNLKYVDKRFNQNDRFYSPKHGYRQEYPMTQLDQCNCCSQIPAEKEYYSRQQQEYKQPQYSSYQEPYQPYYQDRPVQYSDHRHVDYSPRRSYFKDEEEYVHHRHHHHHHQQHHHELKSSAHNEPETNEFQRYTEPGYNQQPRQSRPHSTHRKHLIEHVGPPLMQQPLIQQQLVPPQQQTEPKKKYPTKYYHSRNTSKESGKSTKKN
jgi:hypothetical protein